MYVKFYKIEDISTEEWRTAAMLDDKRQYHAVYKAGIELLW
jgi:hypothetical protein